MLYIHQTACISPIKAFDSKVEIPADNQMKAIEPDYEDIPAGMLRRMGKAVRMAVGSALPLLQDIQPDGIIIGTAHGSIGDSGNFLKQLVDYNEGMLSPGGFVQSTANAIAGQLGMLTHNKNYNITHVHHGHAFENGLVDAAMMLAERPEHTYLVGGVEENAFHNYNLERLDGWYKKESVAETGLYENISTGSIAGEGAAMFLVSGQQLGAIAKLDALKLLHTKDVDLAREGLQNFLRENVGDKAEIDLLLTGENGDIRMLELYKNCESMFGPETAIARYKHVSGEYPTSAAFALWLACQAIQRQYLPAYFIKKPRNSNGFKRILFYNVVKEKQHTMLLLSLVL